MLIDNIGVASFHFHLISFAFLRVFSRLREKYCEKLFNVFLRSFCIIYHAQKLSEAEKYEERASKSASGWTVTNFPRYNVLPKGKLCGICRVVMRNAMENIFMCGFECDRRVLPLSWHCSTLWYKLMPINCWGRVLPVCFNMTCHIY